MSAPSPARPGAPFIAAEIRASLAEVGPLPPDLLAACNGAVHAACLAQGIVHFLTSESWWAPREGTPGPREIIISGLKALYANANPSRQAVAAVAGELNDTRRVRGPFRCGDHTHANGHEAALHWAADVPMRIRWALLSSEVCNEQEPDACRCLADDLASPMDLDFVARHIHEVWRGFSGNRRPDVSAVLAGDLPDFSAMIAEVKIEASTAAAARGLADKLRADRTAAIPTNDRDVIERMALAELLLRGPNATAIAKKVGVKRTTLLSWPTFREYYNRAKKEAEGRRQERRGRHAGERDFEAEEDE